MGSPLHVPQIRNLAFEYHARRHLDWRYTKELMSFSFFFASVAPAPCSDAPELSGADILMLLNGRIPGHANTLLAPFNSLKHKVAVKKAWAAARESMAKPTKQIDEDSPLDPEVVKDLEQKWQGRHKFALASHRVLVDTLMGRRYREAHSTPKRYSILLPEAVRTRASVENHLAKQ